MIHFRSSFTQSPAGIKSDFSGMLTTKALNQSRIRWFETCSCKPVSRGPPSSFTKHLCFCYSGKNTVHGTQYFDCAYWLSAGVAKVLTKGTLVELTGRVSARPWTDKNGQPRASLNFHASRIKLHGGGRRAPEESAPGSAGSEGDNLPF